MYDENSYIVVKAGMSAQKFEREARKVCTMIRIMVLVYGYIGWHYVWSGSAMVETTWSTQVDWAKDQDAGDTVSIPDEECRSVLKPVVSLEVRYKRTWLAYLPLRPFFLFTHHPLFFLFLFPFPLQGVSFPFLSGKVRLSLSRLK